MANPNSSLVYVRYIALQLSRGEVEKARKIAERALQKIGFREEREKQNIWVAYLNLENISGSPETLMKGTVIRSSLSRSMRTTHKCGRSI